MTNDSLDHDFHRLRPRLHGIAYRMLGSAAEADDVVQDAWLRWHGAGRAEAQNAEAWLVSVTTRIAIDRLRSAKARRESYVGTWLPEPLLDAPDVFGQDLAPSPEQVLERANDVSVAFLALLERLGPEARAAYLLREVFDADYDEVAATLGKSEAACRQLVSRAKTQLKEGKPRHAVGRDQQLRLLRGFADAATRGEFTALKAMLAEDSQLIGDGGGHVPSFGKPLEGGPRIAQLYLAVQLRHREALRYEIVALNGEWGLLRFIEGALESAQSLELDEAGERIVRIHSQRNPEKLAGIARALGCALHVTGGRAASS